MRTKLSLLHWQQAFNCCVQGKGMLSKKHTQLRMIKHTTISTNLYICYIPYIYTCYHLLSSSFAIFSSFNDTRQIQKLNIKRLQQISITRCTDSQGLYLLSLYPFIGIEFTEVKITYSLCRKCILSDACPTRF